MREKGCTQAFRRAYEKLLNALRLNPLSVEHCRNLGWFYAGRPHEIAETVPKRVAVLRKELELPEPSRSRGDGKSKNSDG